jgi:hypothetical protein
MAPESLSHHRANMATLTGRIELYGDCYALAMRKKHMHLAVRDNCKHMHPGKHGLAWASMRDLVQKLALLWNPGGACCLVLLLTNKVAKCVVTLARWRSSCNPFWLNTAACLLHACPADDVPRSYSQHLATRAAVLRL